VAPNFWVAFFHSKRYVLFLGTKMVWATFWAIF
jgi:hypothetical protein